ncbi:helix-turn-helix domain-containing protein [Acetobacter senegalensis]|uniref:helix-turn-helix domain-containing protein n=1 Tax=Acetobacter senegalensis TaxID=446692 RepID=UPI001EDAC586|nr:helix-turn-helix transcriptional regulator [Acetobacter senegalensis]MCG4258038.1 helix-turn-helix domain-containing protein [Acetobacter senegalensis]MCG4267965.1 helix-turn-helix domain-containing protein [Acetobacter senegalensis]
MKEKQLTPEEIAKNRHTLRFVKSWMKLRNVTQRKLAEDLNMSEPSVSKWLNGKVNMTLSQFVRIAELLNAKPEELLFDPSEKDKATKYKEAAYLAESLEADAFDAWIAAGKAMRKRF